MPAAPTRKLQIVPLLEDELLRGHRGRIAILNNCQQVRQVQGLVCEAYPAPKEFKGQSPFVLSLALALDVSLRDLIDKHTLWPILAPLPRSDGSGQGDRSPYSDSFAHLWMKTARSHLAFCPDCVADDLSSPRLHIAYWRRSLQLPGLMHCRRHSGTAVLLVEAPSLLDAHPNELHARAFSPSASALEFARKSFVAIQTLELLTLMLAGRTMRPRRLIREALSHQARAKTGENGNDVVRAIAAWVQADVDSTWLSDLMPQNKGVREDQPAYLLGALVNSALPLSAPAAAFVSALLFGSTTEAAGVLFK